jgi:hypothetical protein
VIGTFIRLGAAVTVVLLAACQATAPVSPDPSHPAATEPPLPAAGEAYVVSLHYEEGGPFFDVRVDAVAPTGASRPIASFADVHPAGWETAAPYYDMRTIVGPGRLLPIVAERNGGMEPTDVRTLLLDLRPGAGPPVEIAGAPSFTFWGPDGQLGSVGGQGADLIDVRTGARQSIARPEGIELSPAWLADGAGWTATRFADEPPTPGWLSNTGIFTAGFAPTFQVTGLERFVGANGGTLGIAGSDGPNQSETVLIEGRADLPAPCHCVAWARTVQPGDDPAFSDGIWDADGNGVWLVFTKGNRRWLSHLAEPLVDRPVADLPAAEGWRIAGISSDDRWVVVASPELGSLVLVDTVAGAAREIARVQGAFNPAPTFGGWVR